MTISKSLKGTTPHGEKRTFTSVVIFYKKKTPIHNNSQALTLFEELDIRMTPLNNNYTVII